MEYEKKYKEIIGKIRTAYLYAPTDSTKAVLEEIFPELGESEDERIRKEITELVMQPTWKTEKEFHRRKELCAWLEKQGEQSKRGVQGDCMETLFKVATILLQHVDKEGSPLEQIRSIVVDGSLSAMDLEGQKPAGKVEPKFHVGDWCIDNEDNTIFQIVKVLDNTYTYKTTEGKEYSCTHYSLENDAKLWTIQDAKDGDVLASKDKLSILIFRRLDSSTSFSSYYNIGGKGETGWSNECFIPATKEQRDLLFQKIEDAGYEWDSKKKELKKIEQKPTDEEMKTILQTEYEKGRADAIAEMQKPSWSEEDRTMAFTLMRDVDQMSYISKEGKNERIGWLNSLDEKFASTESAWSEEDERIKNNLVSFLLRISVNTHTDSTSPNYTFYKEIDWLKSLKERYTWKPSDEQMHYLYWIANIKLGDSVVEQEVSKHLNELYQDLKKLKEE